VRTSNNKVLILIEYGNVKTKILIIKFVKLILINILGY